jgi:hypothetical protein
VVERWAETVGPSIARNAWPARLARDGTLHVSTADSVWAFELGHRADEIARRLEVPGVRFTPGPLPRQEPPRPRPPELVPTAEQERQAAALAAAIEDADVRQSVQKAVLLSLLRNASGGPL